ncbi:MAG: hypothetical protein HY578_09960 [Nitrospinae bacterium]|nr:hypothetical protein [Nitrospinota bacterium]
MPKEGRTKEYGSTGGTIPSLPEGISKKQSHQAQSLANNKDIIIDINEYKKGGKQL